MPDSIGGRNPLLLFPVAVIVVFEALSESVMSAFPLTGVVMNSGGSIVGLPSLSGSTFMLSRVTSGGYISRGSTFLSLISELGFRTMDSVKSAVSNLCS